jgi:hypothetical protein
MRRASVAEIFSAILKSEKNRRARGGGLGLYAPGQCQIF